jgi:hypothetical protein
MSVDDRRYLHATTSVAMIAAIGATATSVGIINTTTRGD